MGNLFRQEIFKLSKRKSTIIFMVFLIVENLGMAYLAKVNEKYILGGELFARGYLSYFFIAMALVAACATIISSEFEYDTIKNIVYQPYSRRQIIISKWLAMLSYSIVLYLIASLMSLISKLIWFNHSFQLTQKVYQNESMTILQYWLVQVFGTFLITWLVLSIVLLIASGLKKSAVAVSVGIVGYLSLGLISPIMVQLMKNWHFLKWNPINMMNLPNQLSDHHMSTMTMLTTNELLVGTIVYIVLFMGIGMYAFSRKEV